MSRLSTRLQTIMARVLGARPNADTVEDSVVALPCEAKNCCSCGQHLAPDATRAWRRVGRKMWYHPNLKWTRFRTSKMASFCVQKVVALVCVQKVESFSCP